MISIIIPAYNEEKNIGALILYLQNCCKNDVVEIIVADSASTDDTSTIPSTVGI